MEPYINNENNVSDITYMPELTPTPIGSIQLEVPNWCGGKFADAGRLVNEAAIIYVVPSELP